jgi:hypothetical protein
MKSASSLQQENLAVGPKFDFMGAAQNFKKRARIEAIRQEFLPSQISLECEDGEPQPFSAIPMPQHIKRRLMPPLETAPVAVPSTDPAALTPIRGARR